MKEITCPLCFERIAVPKIGWQCDVPGCNGDIFFRAESEIPSLEKWGLVPSPRKWEHARCKKMASARICPECKGVLPSAIEDLSDLSIAVIGAKESGKSHFVAMLIHRIKELYAEFGWNLVPLNEATIDRYEKEFRKPLFDARETLQTTQSNAGGMKPPLLYSLRLGRRRLMLVFFDAAGEDLQKAANLKHIIRYIYRASGLICLLDPLQLTGIREALMAAGHARDELPMKETETGTIIGRVARVIHDNKDLRGGKIDIPLAVAFSKMDFVPDAGETAQAVHDALYQESRHRGVFHQGEFTNIDGLMRSWVAEVDESRDILQESTEFKKTGFFGFSALGSNPRNGKLTRRPQPFRVEDPFLWILSQKGLVRSTKG